MWDPSHLIKNARNNLKKHGFVLDGKDILSLHVDNFYTAECLINIERKIKRYALNSKIITTKFPKDHPQKSSDKSGYPRVTTRCDRRDTSIEEPHSNVNDIKKRPANLHTVIKKGNGFNPFVVPYVNIRTKSQTRCDSCT